jgi:hypothetical protein
MRVGAELVRMKELSDQWGVAVRVPAVDLVPVLEPSGDADRLTLERIALVPRSSLREVTQTLDRFLAVKYARRLRASVWVLTERYPDENIRKGAEFSVCVKELGPNLPHKLTCAEAQLLIFDIEKATTEIKAREKNGRIWSR